MPPSFGPVPTPYPNIPALDGSNKGMITPTKKSKLKKSTGDEPGTLKGLMSNTDMSKTSPKFGASKVKFEGQNAVSSKNISQQGGMKGSLEAKFQSEQGSKVGGGTQTLKIDESDYK